MRGFRTPPPSLVLAPAVGARLDRAAVQWHVIPGERDSLMRFWLTFGATGAFAGATFGFAVGEDRNALDVVAEEPEVDADLGRYGRLEVRAAAPADPVTAALGQRLVQIEDVYRTDDPRAENPHAVGSEVVAARLAFARTTLWVADLDDDLNWALGDFPERIVSMG